MTDVDCVGCKTKTESRLQCPECHKLGFPGHYFCSQTCFRANWATHKGIHSILAKLKDNVDFCGKESMLFFNPADETTWAQDANLKHMIGYQFSGNLRPYPRSTQKTVPENIVKPDYGADRNGTPHGEHAAKKKTKVDVRTPDEIRRLRAACKLGREALDLAGSMVKEGVTTEEIDDAVHEFVISRGAYPSPLNYYNFPKSCCTSVNEVICHGIPDLRPLQNGDVCNIDITVYLDGMHGDLNETFTVGDVPQETKNLIQAAYDGMMAAIQLCKPGAAYREIGNAIASVVENRGYSVVKTFCGHGIGSLFHTHPNVPHYKKNKAVGVMEEGNSFTIEPMVNMGKLHDVQWPDDWTAVTADGKPSAQFEHTLLITKEGVEILTARTENSNPLIIETENRPPVDN